ncbi:hydrogenase [bacterium]|nr:hydrogenase [bacterium]
MEGAIDTLLVLAVLIGLYMLGTMELVAMIRASAVQGLILALLPTLVRGHLEAHALAIGLATIGLKVFVIPRMLVAAMRRAGVSREIEPLIGFGASVALAGGLIALSLAFGERLKIPGAPISRLLVPCAFSTVLLGLLILVSRTKAISQVVGFLVLENGIFLFGLVLVREMPLLVEMGILLDVFVGVFIMGIVIHHISRAFDHIDTHAMTTLRD